MNAFIAITQLTIRSSLRSYVFHLLLILLGLTIFLLPLTVTGDGTALGQVQISLKYTLGLVSALLAISALWLGSAVFAQDIESYNLHMVFVKPVPRYIIWLGKFSGVFAIQTILILISGIAIYSFVMLRINTASFPQDEIERLKDKILVGRKIFYPKQPNFRKMALNKFSQKIKNGQITKGMNKEIAYSSILKEIKAQNTEVRVRAPRIWRFDLKHFRTQKTLIFLRFKMYIGRVSKKDQRFTEGIWSVRDPKTKTFIPLPRRTMTGSYQELTLTSEVISKDNKVVVSYENYDPRGAPVIFQIDDGPFLMIKEANFEENFIRMLFLMLIQIAFYTSLGCMLGGILSLPVAIYTSFTYIVIGFIIETGMSVPMLNAQGHIASPSFTSYLSYYVTKMCNLIIVSPSEFVVVGQLAKGQLVEIGQMFNALLMMIIFRAIPMAIIGIFIFKNREMGAVIKK